MAKTIWTVGHSNRSLEQFVALLAGEQIGLVADIRRFPASRAHPHFNADALAEALERHGIGFHHYAALGGRRSTRLPDSPNTAWRVDAFNRYADYMAGEAFAAALAELMAAAAERRTAMMCSEAVPWRCHRRLVSDAFIVRGWEALDIVGKGPATPHTLTAFARVEQSRLTCPSERTLFS
jgi:uncharacterized protein (DUF488 family)